jgi:hypothetical protein
MNRAEIDRNISARGRGLEKTAELVKSICIYSGKQLTIVSQWVTIDSGKG